jgi:hypothetical protein
VGVARIYENGCFNLHIVAVHGAKCCAQHTGMHIVVVEALLIAIYLTEKKDVYIPIQPTSLPEATSFSWGLPMRRKLGSESVNPIFENLFFANLFSNGYEFPYLPFWCISR